MTILEEHGIMVSLVLENPGELMKKIRELTVSHKISGLTATVVRKSLFSMILISMEEISWHTT
jgi:hypothetical protein